MPGSRSEKQNRDWRNFSPVVKVPMVLASVGICLALRLAFQSVLAAKAPFATFLPSVLFSAWLFGWWGGVAATVLIVAAYFAIILPSPVMPTHTYDPAIVIPFVIVSLLVSAVADMVNSSNRRLEQSKLDAEEAAEVLRRSEARKATMLQVALDSIITIDAEGRVVEFNPAAERMFGYTRAEIQGQLLCDTIIPPAMREAHKKGMAHYNSSGEGPILGKRIEVTAMRKDGSEFPAELAVVATQQLNGTEFTAYLRDISDRKAFEKQLIAGEERLRLAVEGGAIGTWHWDVKSNDLVWSDTMFSLNGRELTELKGFDSFVEHIHPDDSKRVRRSLLKALETRTDYESEFRVIWPDGTVHWLVAKGRAYYDDDGAPQRMEGVAVETTNRKQAEQEKLARAEREAVISRVEQAWRMSLDADEIRRVAVQALGKALKADRCYFTFFDLPNDLATISDDYYREGFESIAGRYINSDFHVDPSEIFPGNATLVVNDCRTWEFQERFDAAEQHIQVSSAINVPLFDQGAVTATLAVAMAVEPRVWTSEEVEIVEEVAAKTRLAVESAISQQREHRIATELQAALLPDLPESVPGLTLASYMSPALDEASIGGDFCDVFALDKELYAIVLGDVSGKGLAAGAQLATVRNMLRGFMYQYRDPAQAATSLNSILTVNQLLHGFVTAFIGVYSADIGVIKYASCGHEPGLIRRGHGDAIETLEVTGPPLGVDENTIYFQHEFTLSDADTLFLYTDGLTEAGPSRRELLGQAGLTDIFASVTLDSNLMSSATDLVHQVASYAKIGFRDDVCVLLARRHHGRGPLR